MAREIEPAEEGQNRFAAIFRRVQQHSPRVPTEADDRQKKAAITKSHKEFTTSLASILAFYSIGIMSFTQQQNLSLLQGEQKEAADMFLRNKLKLDSTMLAAVLVKKPYWVLYDKLKKLNSVGSWTVDDSGILSGDSKGVYRFHLGILGEDLNIPQFKKK